MQDRLARAAIFLLGSGLLAGCVGEADPNLRFPGRGKIAIEVAPLTYDDVSNAEYTLTVTNAASGGGDTVWSRGLSSEEFGIATGSLAYVGPCDASSAGGINTVTLELTALYAGGSLVPADTYQNPTPVSREIVCLENDDADVTFNLTILRDAQQGFFDVAVEFDDIFCSAKLDCESAPGQDLDLLHRPDGTRDMTAVVGLTCSAGEGVDTYIYMDDLIISCSGLALEVRVDPTGDGNIDTTASPSANADGYLFGASITRDGGATAGTAFWNISLGLDETKFAAAQSCQLIGRATASSDPFPQQINGFPLPADTAYPVIDWAVPLSDASGRVCTSHQVNQEGSGVQTHYLDYIGAPNQLVWANTEIALDTRFEPGTGQVLRSAAAVCNPSCLNGSCVGPNVCDCNGTGYTGAQCETPACTSGCANGGVCVGPETCDCAGTGFDGLTCAADIDECAGGLDNCAATAACANVAGGFTCTCPAGTSGDGTTCDDCAPGTYESGGVCLPCAAGTSQALGGQTACDACPGGEVQPLSGQIACDTCGVGAFDDGTETCAGCADGAVQPDLGQTACTTCGVGTFDGGGEVCLSCAAGTYQASQGQLACIDCAAGTAQAMTGQTSCDACASGSVQPNTGQASCDACAPGTYESGGVCLPCAAGTFQSASGQTSCDICTAGTVQPLTGQATCDACAPGTYESGGVCLPCAAGTFQSASGQTSCDACPAGSEQPLTGQGACDVCGIGTFDDGSGACVACPDGAVQPSAGQTSCTICDVGTFDDASEVCAACAPGTFQASQGQLSCNACAAGTIQPAAGQISCDACAAGSVQPNIGQTTCNQCGVGTFDDGTETCVDCPGGAVQPNAGATACNTCPADTFDDTSEICAACPAGRVQPDAGQTACIPCPAGSFDNGTTSCVACPVGTVQPSVGTTSCNTCASGTYDDTSEICAACTAVLFCAVAETCSDASNSACATCDTGYAQASPGDDCLDIDGCIGNTCGGVTCIDTPAPGTGYTCAVPDATSSLSCSPSTVTLGQTSTCTITPRQGGAAISALATSFSPMADSGTVGGVSPSVGGALSFTFTPALAGAITVGDALASTVVTVNHVTNAGTTSALAGTDCETLLAQGVITSGTYWVDLGGITTRQVYCEQQRHGGGWMMLYNSVGDPQGATLAFWNIVYADRFVTKGTPAIASNYYGPELYRYADEYLDVLADLETPANVAEGFRATAEGIDGLTMEMKNPVYISGNSGIYSGQFGSGWSAPDYDGDTHGTVNCAADYGDVTQHYSSCWTYNLGADADGADRADGGWGPHVHSSTGTGIGLTMGNDGSYGRVGRITRLVKLCSTPGCSPAQAGYDCQDLLDSGATASGLYWIDPTGSSPEQAYCDMDTDGGGWTLVASVATKSTFWDPAIYSAATSARAVTLGSASTASNYMMKLSQWGSLFSNRGASSEFRLTVKRVDTSATETLGFLDGLQMDATGAFTTNPTAARKGNGTVIASPTTACVIQYNSDFVGTITAEAFDSSDAACTGWMGWNGSCGYTSLGHIGEHHQTTFNPGSFSHACSMDLTYYCSSNRTTGPPVGTSYGCNYFGKWYWIR